MSNGWTTSRRQAPSVNNRENTSRYNSILRRHGPAADASTRFGCVVPCKEQARNREGHSADVFHSRRLALHAIQTPALASAPFGQTRRRDLLCPLRLGEWAQGHNNCDRACISSHDVKQPFSFPRRAFAPGLCIFASLTPVEGWAERRETFGCVRGTRWARHDAARQALARRLASHDAGRSPLGAPPWRFWAPGAALLSPHTRLRRSFGRHPDRSQRAPRSQVIVPGGRLPCLPRQAVTRRRRGTPLLAPPSGCLRTTPLNERGCESSSIGTIRSQ
jgi:hypothetical protein